MVVRYFLLVCFYLILSNVNAATFTVSSNADSGTGTLREAMEKAAANGNSETDYILFNLIGSTESSRTISIGSSLPQITSSLIIDGTSQPGPVLSKNGAKIIVQATGPFADPISGMILYRSDCFHLTGGFIFELYGLIVRNFFSSKPDGRFSTGTVLFIDALSAIKIGAPGKGNVFYNNGAGIEAQGINDCLIQSNYIGVKENGIDFSDEIQLGVGIAPNTTLIYGGDTPVEGNVGFGQFSFGGLYDKIHLSIANNIFNANTLYQRDAAAEAMLKKNSFQVQIFSQLIPNLINPPSVLIEKNRFASSLNMAKCNGINLVIRANLFGTTPGGTNVLPVYNYAISLSQNTGTLLIGGANGPDGNVFTGVVQTSGSNAMSAAVVQTNASSKIALSHNSFYCNSLPAFVYTDKGPNEKPVTVSVDALTASNVSGRTRPGATVELFYADQECTGCQPKKYFASVNAGPDGNWTYSNTLQTGYGILASATLDQQSSEFTNTVIYPGEVKIHDATCSSNGSISGLTIVNAKSFEWLNDQGDVVGTDSILDKIITIKVQI